VPNRCGRFWFGIRRTVVLLRFNQTFSAFKSTPLHGLYPQDGTMSLGHNDFGPKFSGMARDRHTIVGVKKQFLYQKTEAAFSDHEKLQRLI